LALAAASDTPVRPPSPASESAAESGEGSDAEWADLGATGVRDRDPPTTTLPGDAYQTPPAGAGAGTEGAQAQAPPSPVSLAQVGPEDGLSGPDVVDVDPAEVIATDEAQDLGAGPPGPQAEKVSSPPRVEQSDSIKTTNPQTLDLETSQTLALETQTHTRVETRTLTLVPSEPGAREPRESGPPPMSRFDTVGVSCSDYPPVCDDSERQHVVRSTANPFDKPLSLARFNPTHVYQECLAWTQGHITFHRS